jgi:hypothetical protein
MGKYDYFKRAQEDDNSKKEVHPVWRGIGCLLNILTPIISGAAAMVVVEYGKSQGWPFLSQLGGYFRFSDVFYRIAFVKVVANYISSIPDFKALALFFVVFVMVFSSIFAIINAVLYRTFGPPRYSRLDAPAPRVKTKRYTR